MPPIIYADIGGIDRWIWFVLGNLLSLAAVCPFVGSLSDLMGRRYVAITGAAFIVLGMIICSTAHTMNTFICGMVFAGVGAGINELTALAVTSELAPTAKRGKYVAILIFTIIPFCPSVLWGQLIAAHAGWRWIGLLCGLWACVGLVLTAIFYHPPPRPNSQGLTKKEVLRQIDWIGGFLSIFGMVSSARIGHSSKRTALLNGENFVVHLFTTDFDVAPIHDGYAMGRISVQMGQRSRLGTAHHRAGHAHRFRPLGGLRRQEPNVSACQRCIPVLRIPLTVLTGSPSV